MGQEGDGLDGLPKPHLVGENTVEVPLVPGNGNGAAGGMGEDGERKGRRGVDEGNIRGETKGG